MPTLYEITSDYRALYEAMAAGDDLTDEQITALTDLSGSLTDKLDAYGCVRAELKVKAAALKAEEDRLAAWRKTIESHITRLERGIETAMLMSEQDKVETAHWRYGFRKSTAVEPIADFAVWAEANNRFDLIRVTTAPVLSAIREAIERGQDIPATIVERRSLQVR